MIQTVSTELAEVNFSEQDGVRFLHLGTEWVQGSMTIKKPFEIELEYVQRMMAWLLWTELSALPGLHTMQLGLGAATLTKFCHHRLGCRATAVEINPQVVAACRGWFKLPPDGPRLKIILADAGLEIQNPVHHSTVDALQVDLYDHEAAAPVLDSADFYADCRKLLTPDGVMSVNLFGRTSSYPHSLKKITAAFGVGHVWAFKPTREGNTVVLAQRTAVALDATQLVQKAKLVHTQLGLPTAPWARALALAKA